MAPKVLIIDAGVAQNHANGKLNHTYAQIEQDVLTERGYDVTITRVAEDFDPQAEAQKILAADYLIVQTPAFWMSIPWQLKRYMDIVFCEPGISNGDGRHREDPSSRYGTGGVLKNKHYMISITWNAPKVAFSEPEQFFEQQGIDGVLFPVHKAFEFIGMQKMPTFMVNDVIKNPDFEGDKASLIAHLKANF